MQLTPCVQTFIDYLEYDSKFVEERRWGKRNRWHMFSKSIHIWGSLSVSLIQTEPLDGRWKSRVKSLSSKLILSPIISCCWKSYVFAHMHYLKNHHVASDFAWGYLVHFFFPFYTWRYFVLISTVWCSIKEMNLLLWFQLRFAFQTMFKIGLMVFNKFHNYVFQIYCIYIFLNMGSQIAWFSIKLLFKAGWLCSSTSKFQVLSV